MAGQHWLTRGLGLLEGTALNMSNMLAVCPFVTIPLPIGAMGGTQCLLGWAVGTVLALSDGLVWAEPAAAMPAEGGSYLYDAPVPPARCDPASAAVRHFPGSSLSGYDRTKQPSIARRPPGRPLTPSRCLQPPVCDSVGHCF
jgi:hypothetical protein